jgi:hypothetical protein
LLINNFIVFIPKVFFVLPVVGSIRSEPTRAPAIELQNTLKLTQGVCGKQTHLAG